MSVDALYEMQMGWSAYHYSSNSPLNWKDPSGLSETGEVVKDDQAGGTIEWVQQVGYRPMSVSGVVWDWFISSSMRGDGSYGGGKGGGDFGGKSTGSSGNVGSLVSTSGRITTAPAIRLDDIVVEAPRGPIEIGMFTEQELVDIADQYRADGHFPTNVNEILAKSPSHHLWDFKRPQQGRFFNLTFNEYALGGRLYKKDFIGNVLWGMILAQSGWPLGISLMGAGFAQSVLDGSSTAMDWVSNWASLGDDPRDSFAITVGYYLAVRNKIASQLVLHQVLPMQLDAIKAEFMKWQKFPKDKAY